MSASAPQVSPTPPPFSSLQTTSSTTTTTTTTTQTTTTTSSSAPPASSSTTTTLTPNPPPRPTSSRSSTTQLSTTSQVPSSATSPTNSITGALNTTIASGTGSVLANSSSISVPTVIVTSEHVSVTTLVITSHGGNQITITSNVPSPTLSSSNTTTGSGFASNKGAIAAVSVVAGFVIAAIGIWAFVVYRHRQRRGRMVDDSDTNDMVGAGRRGPVMGDFPPTPVHEGEGAYFGSGMPGSSASGTENPFDPFSAYNAIERNNSDNSNPLSSGGGSGNMNSGTAVQIPRSPSSADGVGIAYGDAPPGYNANRTMSGRNANQPPSTSSSGHGSSTATATAHEPLLGGPHSPSAYASAFARRNGTGRTPSEEAHVYASRNNAYIPVSLLAPYPYPSASTSSAPAPPPVPVPALAPVPVRYHPPAPLAPQLVAPPVPPVRSYPYLGMATTRSSSPGSQYSQGDEGEAAGGLLPPGIERAGESNVSVGDDVDYWSARRPKLEIRNRTSSQPTFGSETSKAMTQDG